MSQHRRPEHGVGRHGIVLLFVRHLQVPTLRTQLTKPPNPISNPQNEPLELTYRIRQNPELDPPPKKTEHRTPHPELRPRNLRPQFLNPRSQTQESNPRTDLLTAETQGLKPQTSKTKSPNLKTCILFRQLPGSLPLRSWGTGDANPA